MILFVAIAAYLNWSTVKRAMPRTWLSRIRRIYRRRRQARDWAVETLAMVSGAKGASAMEGLSSTAVAQITKIVTTETEYRQI